jgi:putative oxidoreductase
MESTLIYFLARLFTCGIWTAAGTYKAFHYKQTTVEMTCNHVPWSKYVLPGVLIMEFGGSILLITNQFVWAVALVWIVFTIPASFLYHCAYYDKDGNFIFPQMVQFAKNVSIIGGLLCLFLLDPDKPQWLVAMLR